MLSLKCNTYSTIRSRTTGRQRALLVAATLGALLTVPTGRAEGQATEMPAEVMDQISKQLSAALSKAFSRMVTIAPAIVEVDAKTKTTTLEFTNPTEDTLETEIRAGTTRPMMGMGEQRGGAAQAGGLLAEDDAADAKGKSDSIDAKWSLAPWVKGLPPKLKLAPGEKKKITVTLDVPADAVAGDYSAWIITETGAAGKAKTSSTDDASGTSMKMEINLGGPGQTMKIPFAAKLTYRVAK